MTIINKQGVLVPIGVVLLTFVPASLLMADETNVKVKDTAPIAPFVIAKPVEGYQPVVSVTNIAPTAGTVEDASR